MRACAAVRDTAVLRTNYLVCTVLGKGNCDCTYVTCTYRSRGDAELRGLRFAPPRADADTALILHKFCTRACAKHKHDQCTKYSISMQVGPFAGPMAWREKGAGGERMGIHRVNAVTVCIVLLVLLLVSLC